MQTIIIGAAEDLGVAVDGAASGPETLIKHLTCLDSSPVILRADPEINKSRDKNDLRKNETELLKYNTGLYQAMTRIKDSSSFVVMLGGDHAAAVPSILSSEKAYGRIGVIWIDAHADFNTFETTLTGNLHGLPLAAVGGFGNREMISFHHGRTISQNNIVIVGGRDIDPQEKINLAHSDVTVFTTEDIRQKGASFIMEKALEIAGRNTQGIHISYDLDVIDPAAAPGVSVPAKDGITEKEADELNKAIIRHIDNICSYDLVELNPRRDQDRKTEKIALHLLNDILDALKKL